MKKVYLSFCSVVMLAALNAQTTFNAVSPKTSLNHKMPAGKAIKAEPIVRNKAQFFSNDFSNPADWIIGNNSGNADNWVVGTTPPSGTFALDPITSTSAANGFGLYDSDLMCSGVQTGWLQLANPIDCSAHPAVAIDFEQFFRSFQDQTFVQVSTDGVNWTDFEVNADLDDNSSTANPELVSINISAVAGGQSTVYIRFYFYSEANVTGPLGGCAYSWMVDDVSLRDLDPFDLRLIGAYWGTEGFWGARLPYPMVPSSQIAPVKFAGIVENAGGSAQNDVVFTATSTGYNGVSSATPLAAAEIDTLPAATDLSLTTALGTVSVAMDVSSGNTDAIPGDNSMSQNIQVTATTYARDMGTVTGGSYNQGNGFEVGNIFDMFNDDVATGAKVFITSTANEGASVYARLYSIDGVTGDFVFAVESDLHTITAAELGTEITLNFQSTFDLLADSSYLLVAGSFGDGGATNDLVVGTSGTSEAQTCFYFDMTDQTWYYTTSTPMVRLEVEGIASLTENEAIASFNMYPNPAADQVNLSFNLKNESKVAVNITDLTGKTVYTADLGNKTSGNHEFSVNTNALSNGVYVVNLSADHGVTTQKLVLKK